jgi:hypothetical protein
MSANYKSVATKAGELLKYATTVNGIDRCAHALFDFPCAAHSNPSITSARSGRVHDWLLTLADNVTDAARRDTLATQFLEDLTPADLLPELRSLLRRAGVRAPVPGPSAPVLISLVKAHDLPGVETEFNRAAASVEQDPAAAVTAASALLESLFQTIIEEEQLAAPSDMSIKPLWKVVAQHLKFNPADQQSDDLRKILSGLASIVEGVGAFRTHAGTAHGRTGKAYRPLPRHARLTVCAAHTLAAFVLETWISKKSG